MADQDIHAPDRNTASQNIVSPTYNTYSTGPGLQSGQAGDVGYNGNAPGVGESYANAALGYYGAGNIPGVSNNQQQNYNRFASSTPADMSSYYDNASRLQANAINTQMAARGSYGSSNAVGQLSAAETNLRAQQARDEAQYGLQRASLGGQLAGGADSQSNNASANQLQWTKGLGDLAMSDQNLGAARYEMGNQDAANFAGALSGLEGDAYAGETNQDYGAMNDAIGAETGFSAQGANYAQNQANQEYNQGKDSFDAAMGIVRLGAGAFGA